MASAAQSSTNYPILTLEQECILVKIQELYAEHDPSNSGNITYALATVLLKQYQEENKNFKPRSDIQYFDLLQNYDENHSG